MSDLWSYLLGSDKPLVMYGMGNGADKIIAVLANYGLEVSDFFASDDFVRGQSFHGKTVMTFSQIKEKYGDFIILLSFATRIREVMEKIYGIAERYELYAPDVPVVGNNIFDCGFYEKNLDKFDRARSLLCDSLSEELFDNIISYKLSGRISCLKSPVSSEEDIWKIFRPRVYGTAVDAGAYTGDTAKEMMRYCPDLKKIYAFEPDPKNFSKLASLESDIIEKYNIGLSDGFCETEFYAGAGRGALRKENGGSKAVFNALDGVVSEKIDYIKYDVEGSEKKALKGSEEIIQKYRPDLRVSLYHRSEDIFELPLLINSICGEYRMYLRRKPCLPAWELDLLCVK